MFAKVKYPVFIDALKLELANCSSSCLRAVLKDEGGRICGTLEATLPEQEREITWRGLNHLPYGVYTLEVSQGEDEMKTRLVKRV
ncbi:MAG: hypothetical protein EAZ16_03140 [Sphingobacteriales bacterium]|jgi:hypothetical protein|nr:MAG: hypothetical protein EAZ16_03140 [Sphingobacteriales bacterium]